MSDSTYLDPKMKFASTGNQILYIAITCSCIQASEKGAFSHIQSRKRNEVCSQFILYFQILFLLFAFDIPYI